MRACNDRAPQVLYATNGAIRRHRHSKSHVAIAAGDERRQTSISPSHLAATLYAFVHTTATFQLKTLQLHLERGRSATLDQV
jgi:hypothetical protein